MSMKTEDGSVRPARTGNGAARSHDGVTETDPTTTITTTSPDESGTSDDPAEAEESEATEMREAFDASFAIELDSRYLLHNRTPYLIQIPYDGGSEDGDDGHYGELVLPPFAERIIKGARLRPFARHVQIHRQRHEIFVKRHEDTVTWFEKLIWFVWAALVAWIAITIFDVVKHGTVARTEWLGATGGALVIIGAVLSFALVREVRRKQKAAQAATEAGDIALGLGGSYTDGNETARSAHQLLVLGMVMLVGAVLPTIAIVWGTDAKEFLAMEGGLHVIPGQESRLVSRIIQITYAVILSLFPALLFFQFDRQRAGSLRAKWVHAIFRMDGRMRTLADVHATYGNSMNEASNNSDDKVRGLGGKHSPIIVATILIALGWTTLVLQTESFDFSATTKVEQQAALADQAASDAADAAADAAAAAETGDADTALAARDRAESARDTAVVAAQRTADLAERSTQNEAVPAATDEGMTMDGRSAAEIAEETSALAGEASQAADAARSDEQQIQRTSFFQLLTPNPSAAGMAFLGAYFFGVYLILRSYFGGDLRPKIYNQISARLVTVVVIAYLLRALLTDPTSTQETIWVIAFVAGIVPTTAIDRVFKLMGGWTEKITSGVFSAKRPLTHIDGVDIYESSRLESEGIPDVVALASSDLAALMINTRMPIGHLVDWADQAALMVVVGQGTGREVDPRLIDLRARGIRTGTEMLAACEGRTREEVPAVAKILEAPPVVKGAIWRARHAEPASIPTPEASPTDTPDTETVASETAEAVSNSVVATDPAAPPAPKKKAPKVDFEDLCNAIRRQLVMAQVLQWRSSQLVDIDRHWILLPEMGADAPRSRTYRGPVPVPPDESVWDTNDSDESQPVPSPA